MMLNEKNAQKVIDKLNKVIYTIPVDEHGMKLQCPVCKSMNTRKDFDFPDTMRDCDDCGSEWNIDNDIVLNGRDVK